MTVHSFNPSIQETEPYRSRVQGHSPVQVPKQPNVGSEGYNKTKGHVLAPTNSRAWQPQPCGSDFTGVEGVPWTISAS